MLEENNIYWNQFYANRAAPAYPSPFAEWVYNKWIAGNTEYPIMDCGCGNGRDTVFFAKNGMYAIGIDSCQAAIDSAKLLADENMANTAWFMNASVTDISKIYGYHHVYSRFSLHSMDVATEDIFIKKSACKVGDRCILAIEARSTRDEENHVNADHARRFIDANILLEKIYYQGLDVCHFEESQGLAVYKNENPWIIRIIARRT